jgi:hypothetical protein
MPSFLDVLFLIALGRVLIYLWMEFPLPEWVDNSKFGKLHICRLCSGFWIYSFLFVVFGVDILEVLGFSRVFVLGGILSGGAITYLMDLLEIGFREKFMSIVIE